MAGYWERRKEKKRRAAEIKKASDREIKAVKDVVAANKAAVKAFLKEYKKTHSKEEYKAKSDFYNKQLSQNDKWAKLKVAYLEAESKSETMMSVGAVDDKVSKFYAWRLGNAITASNAKRAKVGEYLNELAGVESGLRGEQIENEDLSFVVIHEWDIIPQTTVEEVKRELLAREAAVQQPEETPVEAEREEEAVEFVRQRVDYQKEVENHVDGPSQAVVQDDELESEKSAGGAEWIVLSDSGTHTSDLNSVEMERREREQSSKSVGSDESLSSEDWSSEYSTEDLELD